MTRLETGITFIRYTQSHDAFRNWNNLHRLRSKSNDWKL